MSIWQKKFKEANKSLRDRPDLNDYDDTAKFDKEISDKFALLDLPNGKKAFVEISRVWIFRGQMYGGWRCLKTPNYAKVRINARAIPPVHGVEYQVTFCHGGVFGKDDRSRKWIYSEQMDKWIEKLVTADKLDEELKTFSSIYKGQ